VVEKLGRFGRSSTTRLVPKGGGSEGKTQDRRRKGGVPRATASSCGNTCLGYRDKKAARKGSGRQDGERYSNKRGEQGRGVGGAFDLRGKSQSDELGARDAAPHIAQTLSRVPGKGRIKISYQARQIVFSAQGKASRSGFLKA